MCVYERERDRERETERENNCHSKIDGLLFISSILKVSGLQSRLATADCHKGKSFIVDLVHSTNSLRTKESYYGLYIEDSNSVTVLMSGI